MLFANNAHNLLTALFCAEETA